MVSGTAFDRTEVRCEEGGDKGGDDIGGGNGLSLEGALEGGDARRGSKISETVSENSFKLPLTISLA